MVLIWPKIGENNFYFFLFKFYLMSFVAVNFLLSSMWRHPLSFLKISSRCFYTFGNRIRVAKCSYSVHWTFHRLISPLTLHYQFCSLFANFWRYNFLSFSQFSFSSDWKVLSFVLAFHWFLVGQRVHFPRSPMSTGYSFADTWVEARESKAWADNYMSSAVHLIRLPLEFLQVNQIYFRGAQTIQSVW